MKMAVTIPVLELTFLAFLAVGIQYCDGNDDYCRHGCCGSECCYDADGELSSGAWAGIIIAAVVVKLLFWGFCCFVIRRRRQQPVMVFASPPQTSVQVSTSNVSTNPAHEGYNQTQPQGRAMQMAPPPYSGHVTQQAPPPPVYEAGYAHPPPK